MVKISSVDFGKRFGRCRELALKEPVAVTHHGRESLAVLSAEEFKRLKALDKRQALYTWELPEESRQGVGRGRTTGVHRPIRS